MAEGDLALPVLIGIGVGVSLTVVGVKGFSPEWWCFVIGINTLIAVLRTLAAK